ncbi:MAG: aspartate/glutamate racemase family protein [Thermodesulfobacteriota bacterium]|nr:aspartate/glutamate racemase family protein [Thermodesulfobacteriota bacterium]
MNSDKSYHIRIIVPANTDVFNNRIMETVKPVLPPDVVVDVRNILHGNPCIENRFNLTENALYVVNMAKASAQEGIQGIYVSDFDYCGVEPSREVVDIPVIGAFRASAYSAMMLSQRFNLKERVLKHNAVASQAVFNFRPMNAQVNGMYTSRCRISILYLMARHRKKLQPLSVDMC